MHYVTLAGASLLCAGCALVDPHIPVGPEDGYCYASRGTSRFSFGQVSATDRQRTATVSANRSTSNTQDQSASSGRSSQNAARGDCPDNHTRHHAWVGSRETGANLDEALAFLRDRRREMAQRERQLASINGYARLGVAASALTALGGAAFGASRDLILGAGLATGTSYVAGYGFAPQSMRDVLNAGSTALTCLEARALSARIQPSSRLNSQRAAVSSAIAAFSAQIASAKRNLEGDPSPDQNLKDAIANGEDAISSARAVLSNLSGAPLSGPLIANALYDRTLSIVIQVNSEIDRATPNLDAIVNLARNSVGSSINGVADASAALSQATTEAREAHWQTQAPRTTSAPGPTQTIPGGSGIASAADQLIQKLEELSVALATLTSDPITQIRSCAFQQMEGRGLTLSPGTTPTIGSGTAAASLVVTGGRGPYRMTRTGSTAGDAAKLSAEPEYSPGQFTLRNTGAGAGNAATFLITDQGGESAVITLTVIATPRN